MSAGRLRRAGGAGRRDHLPQFAVGLERPSRLPSSGVPTFVEVDVGEASPSEGLGEDVTIATRAVEGKFSAGLADRYASAAERQSASDPGSCSSGSGRTVQQRRPHTCRAVQCHLRAGEAADDPVAAHPRELREPRDPCIPRLRAGSGRAEPANWPSQRTGRASELAEPANWPSQRATSRRLACVSAHPPWTECGPSVGRTSFTAPRRCSRARVGATRPLSVSR